MSSLPKVRGRRVILSPLVLADFDSWRMVRGRNVAWLKPWEPRGSATEDDSVAGRRSFEMRCSARDRDRQVGTGWAFGVFVGPNLIGEINLSNVVRGAFQSGHVGYWIDRDNAGNGYAPEALALLIRFAFEKIGLHRIQVSIVPRNTASRRVVEKLDLRCEGLAERYLEIAGIWEDHLRYAITLEEWHARQGEFSDYWQA